MQSVNEIPIRPNSKALAQASTALRRLVRLRAHRPGAVLNGGPYLHELPDFDRDTIAVHGDLLELESKRWFLCRICDRFAPGAHFRLHPREENIFRYWLSFRMLDRLTARRSINRLGLDVDNLIRRALERERTKSPLARESGAS